MPIITIILLFLIVNRLYCVTGANCKQDVEVADQCAQHLTLFGNPDVVIPVTEDDMDQYCNATIDSVRCLRRFGRQCLPTFTRQAMLIFTHNMRKLIVKRCRRQSQYRKDFLEFAKCWTPKERLQKTNLCVDRHNLQLEHISKDVESEHQIPAICCTLHQRNDCIKKEMSQICDEQNVGYIMRMIDDSVGQLITYACNRYQTVHACDRNLPSKVWQPIKDVVNIEDPKLLAAKRRYKSSLTPIVEIVTQFKF